MASHTYTYLRILCNCLSGHGKKIFPNQVVFYHSIFGVTNPDVLPEEELAGLQRIILGGVLEGDSVLIKRVVFLLNSGLDCNSANIGKHINSVPEQPIPKQHKAHFGEASNKDSIINRLCIAMRFCQMLRPETLRMGEADFRKLLEQMKERFKGVCAVLQKAQVFSMKQLAEAVYEILMLHLSGLRQCNPAMGLEAGAKVNLSLQREEYQVKVACYREDGIDRFCALKRLAETNVVAACELGRVYYYGNQYHVDRSREESPCIYQVMSDCRLAEKCFRKAVNCNPPLPEACWFLGKIIWDAAGGGLSEECARESACRYFSYAIEHGYIPACDSLGKIELSRGEALWGKRSSLSGREREEMLEHYRRGLELCDRAGCGGWVYGHIRVALFLGSEAGEEIWPAIRDYVRMEGPRELRQRWQAAAELGNPMAIERLALLQ